MAAKKKTFLIPEPSLRRLPMYYNFLQEVSDPEKKYISCTEIACTLNLSPIQVRKDIEFTQIIGKPKIGYEISDLKEAIKIFLGWDNNKNAILIGVGYLGTALLGYEGFLKNGINIIAAFDSDQNKIGKKILSKKIQNINKLPNFLSETEIKICILTVPATIAQEITNTVIRFGIKAIWNFSPCILNIPKDVIVQNENLTASITVLVKKLSYLNELSN